MQPHATSRYPPGNLQATPGIPQALQRAALGRLKQSEVDRMFALSDNKSAWSQPGGGHGGSSGCPRRRYGLKFIFKF